MSSLCVPLPRSPTSPFTPLLLPALGNRAQKPRPLATFKLPPQPLPPPPGGPEVPGRPAGTAPQIAANPPDPHGTIHNPRRLRPQDPPRPASLLSPHAPSGATRMTSLLRTALL